MNFQFESQFSVAAPDVDVASFAWSPDGRQVAVLAALTRRAIVFRIPEGTRAAAVGDLAGGASSIAWTADGRVVIPLRSSDSGALTVWSHDTDQFAAVPGVSAGDDPVGNLLASFVVDRTGQALAGNRVVRRGAATDGEIVIHETRGWNVRARIPLATTRMAFSPDRRRLATVGQSGMVKIFDMDSGSLTLEFAAGNNRVKELDWSPDGSTIATGTMGEGYGRIRETGQYGPLRDDQVLKLWDAASGALRAAVREPVGGGVESLEFSSDGRHLLTVTSDRVCRVWSAQKLAMTQVVAEKLGPTTALARFSPDNQRILIVKKSTAEALLYRQR